MNASPDGHGGNKLKKGGRKGHQSKVNKYWEDVNVVREEGCTDGPEGDGCGSDVNSNATKMIFPPFSSFLLSDAHNFDKMVWVAHYQNFILSYTLNTF